MKPADLLNEAAGLVSGERNKAYGDAYQQHVKAARMWSAYLQAKYGISPELSASDVCHLMSLLKWSREMSGPFKADNNVDDCGYAALAGYCAWKEHEQ